MQFIMEGLLKSNFRVGTTRVLQWPQDAIESTQKSDEEREEAEESVASLGGGEVKNHQFRPHAHVQHLLALIAQSHSMPDQPSNSLC